MIVREVGVLLWTGLQIVRRLGPDDPAPTVEELEAIAVAHTAWNDGVKPTVRVLEKSTVPGRSLGPAAGSVPPRLRYRRAEPLPAPRVVWYALG